MPSNGGHTSPVATSTTQSVYIRVAQVNVLPIPDPATNPPLTPTSGHLYLIEGTIDAIGRYAGTTVDWLVKVAHLICDPRGGGQLYTHPGDSSDWYDLDRTPSWHKVVQGDPLLPAIYEFVPTAPIFLSKISCRHMHSAITGGSQSSAATFLKEIGQREGGGCAVTRAPAPLNGSYLILKRMGSDGARDVVTRFCGESAALGIHRFHPKLGILLFCTLDPLVDNFALGFYHVTVSYNVEFRVLLLNCNSV
ncbi:hypothetical protein BS47DRAFT_857231 [Hydnum rufescens UP504]|uniref:Uncharacterized protein n=1 Tax=Hydnum rufescens UP504 TaxID=1448309 RepID=A0A9P6ACF4_9AGAM|nr:hypothetical protein BS47DRAFT_857231 [Hydnum rufescens UP504]